MYLVDKTTSGLLVLPVLDDLVLGDVRPEWNGFPADTHLKERIQKDNRQLQAVWKFPIKILWIKQGILNFLKNLFCLKIYQNWHDVKIDGMCTAHLY